MTTKTLELYFQTAEGKSAKISVPDPKEPVDALAVQQAMDLIVAKNIFLFATGEIAAKANARVVERTITDVVSA